MSCEKRIKLIAFSNAIPIYAITYVNAKYKIKV